MISFIKNAEASDAFHDARLVDIKLEPSLKALEVVLSVLDVHSGDAEERWRIRFSGLLRLEFETVGTGAERSDIPIEVYSVYEDEDSEVSRRCDLLETLCRPKVQRTRSIPLQAVLGDEGVGVEGGFD